MDQAYKFLKNEVEINSKLIVGISGGPDSMALLNLLLDLKKEQNIEIICAHINHNSGREGQIKDQEFVKEYCKKNNIIFELMIIDEYKEKNFHNEAHKKRYDFFEKLVNKYQAKYVLTAHHGDDLIETILMRIVRGSTLKGYAGFEQVTIKENYKILRPLVLLTKEEIIEYNNKNKIEYVIDDSNSKDVYTRNRYRKYVIPQLKQENSKVHQKFYKFSKTLELANKYIESQVDLVFHKVYKNNKIDIIEFNKLEYLIKIKIIERILEEIYDEDLIIINSKHIDMIYNLSLLDNNSSIVLPNDLIVVKEYTEIIFTTKKENVTYNICIDNNLINLLNGKTIEQLSDKAIAQKDNYICRLNKDEVKLPLYIRTRKSGDKMDVKNLNGSKKIKEIFIENKISKSEREVWPVVVDSEDNIVWLPGLKKSKYDKQISEKYDIILKYY